MSAVKVGDRIRIITSHYFPQDIGLTFNVVDLDEDRDPLYLRSDGLEEYSLESNYEILTTNTLPEQTFPEQVDQILGALGTMLKAKNAAYGNAALDPVRVFSRADKVEQIRVRLDDKLSRLARGSNAGEDVIVDLMGYLVLLQIAEATR